MTPKRICRSMGRVQRWLYFFRNNPRFRARYYHELIAWVGYDRWKYVVPEVRNTWESSRNSFDRLLGLAVALKHLEKPEDILDPDKYPEKHTPVTQLSDAMEKASDIFSELSRYESRIPDAYKPEGIRALKELIRIYADKADTPVKDVLIDYLGDIEECALKARETKAAKNAEDSNKEKSEEKESKKADK